MTWQKRVKNAWLQLEADGPGGSGFLCGKAWVRNYVHVKYFK